MKFSTLALFLDKIESTSSRLAITNLLSEMLKKIELEEIGKTIYLLQGRVTPVFESTVFGMAEKTVIKSISTALNLDKRLFEKEYKKNGDLGRTVELFKNQIHSFDEKDLSITELFNDLYKLAMAAGKGSQEIKQNILANLIRQLDPVSSRYVVRIPLGIMRMGFSDMTILDVLSWMLVGSKDYRPQIQKAYHVRPDLGYIAGILKQKGIEGLKHIRPQVFYPIIMMRAERLSSGKEIIEKIGQCLVEPKYDGFRLQVHFKNQLVRLYSRSLEEVSFMYPDIIEGIKKQIKSDEIIIEGEAIGFDPQTGNFLPFQETVQRKRKFDITEKAKEIPLKLFVFELLYSDGIDYIDKPYIERRRLLEKKIVSSGDVFQDTILIAKENIIDNKEGIELAFDESITNGLEGIIAKKLQGIYQPGARGWNWIKFKKSYSSKIKDTLDCLVMGYDYGKGKRTDFGIGAFLVGIYDEENDQFQTVAKIGTGLTDKEWIDLKSKAMKFQVKTKPQNYIVDKAMDCDIWLSPEIVVEIKADEITRSPVHTAGRKLKFSKTGQTTEVDIPGYALRFPRLETFREDKRPEDATTLSEITQIGSQGK